MNGLGPCIAQTTSVPPPCGTIVNSAMLCASQGARKSSLMVILSGDSSRISIEPVPTFLLSKEALPPLIFDEWNREAANHDDDLAAAWAKLEAYAPRFALIHHLALTYANLVPSSIGAESMAAGIALVEKRAVRLARRHRGFGAFDRVS